MTSYRVMVGYDENLATYYVLESDSPGLDVEAPTFEAFVAVTQDLAPDLLDNGAERSGIDVIGPKPSLLPLAGEGWPKAGGGVFARRGRSRLASGSSGGIAPHPTLASQGPSSPARGIGASAAGRWRLASPYFTNFPARIRVAIGARPLGTSRAFSASGRVVGSALRPMAIATSTR